jgi:hypothetical protein
MKRFIIIGAILVILVAGMAVSSMTRAFADNPPGTGQPSQSCQAVFGPGTPLVPNGFNTNGFANAEAHYAGSQPQNSNNPNSVAQYDVACFQAGQH